MFSLRSPARLALAGCLLLGMMAIAADPPIDEKQKQVEELEKQLQALQKKLAEVKAQPTSTTPAPKKPLTFADADKWRSIRGAILSNDGNWFAHRVGPAEGDSEVILRNTADGKETKFPGGRGGLLEFSFDSKWLAFSVTPAPARPGLPTVPASGASAKPKIVLVKLATGEKTEIEGVTSAQFSGEGATHVAFRKATDAPAAPTLPSGVQLPPGITLPAPATGSGAAGADLVLRDLAAGTEMVLGNVADFSFDKKGKWLVMVIDAAGQLGNGIQVRDLATGLTTQIESGAAVYRNLTWHRDFTAFTVLKGVDDKAYEGKVFSVLGFTGVGDKPTKVTFAAADHKDFPVNMGVSGTRPAAWNDDLTAITFGIAEQKKKEEPKKETAPDPKDTEKKKEKVEYQPGQGKKGPPTTTPAAGKPDLIVWHWKDERPQPMQELQAGADKAATFTCVFWVKEKKFVRLADETLKSVGFGSKAKFAVGTDGTPYNYMSNLDGRRYADVYTVDPQTGKKTKALTKARYFNGTNPTATQLLHYDDGHFFVYDIAAGKSINITEKVTGTSFIDVEDDHNVVKPPTRPLGWSKDGKFVLISDGWDIWKVAADGSGGTNLTVNGKATGTRYTGFQQFDPDRTEPGFDLEKPAFVTTYGEWTKQAGVGKLEPGKPGVTVLMSGDFAFGFGGVQKARNAEKYLFTKETYSDAPNYHLTDATFKTLTKVTNSNPQQADYAWSSGAKLVEYKGLGGKRLQGALYLPANYEPGKRYPTIVYIYEKLSNGLHRYTPPFASGSGFNSSVYTSNGYAVFTPDIVYRLNDPGVSAVECVLPALDAAIATGIVDPARVGLQGHSWGGYQTSFLVTQTTRFKAAVAGAPLTDLISMYSSMYWNSGSANQPIFESSQGRFTGGYWEQQEAYIRNSPVFHATKVQTPLVILHNDKDGAVDFVQGIEYFNTLRRLQKPVVMLQYKGENHGLAKAENRKDYAARMKEFFDHHLQGKPAPDWWTEGVPHLKMDDHLKTRKN